VQNVLAKIKQYLIEKSIISDDLGVV